MKKTALFSLIALAAASFAVSASAKDQSVGMLGKVQGNISIGGNGYVSKATSGTPVVDGSTVMVSSNGRTTVKYNNGCVVALEGGQHLTVDSKASCVEQQASVKQLFSPYRVAQAGIQSGIGGGGAGGGAAGAGVGLGIAGGIIAVGAIDVNRTEDKNSGS